MRVRGDLNVMAHWVGEMPVLELENDSVVFKGLLSQRHPYRSLFYRILARSKTLKCFKYNTPTVPSEKDYRLTAKIIAESAKMYEEQFGNNKFYMVITPNNDTTILKYLKPYSIKIINLAGITDYLDDPTYYTPLDRHPSNKAHKRVAEEIIKSLGDL